MGAEGGDTECKLQPTRSDAALVSVNLALLVRSPIEFPSGPWNESKTSSKACLIRVEKSHHLRPHGSTTNSQVFIPFRGSQSQKTRRGHTLPLQRGRKKNIVQYLFGSYGVGMSPWAPELNHVEKHFPLTKNKNSLQPHHFLPPACGNPYPKFGLGELSLSSAMSDLGCQSFSASGTFSSGETAATNWSWRPSEMSESDLQIRS